MVVPCADALHRAACWRGGAGEYKGVTGKPLTDGVSIGIGGRHGACCVCARTLSFLANVDPEDVSRALKGKNPETTLVIVVSKTFTTAETMLNARTVRQWITESLGPEAVRTHMVAVSTNLESVAAFGLDPENAFGFWDWVGGRYSVTSAVGLLPLALQYGYPLCERFLAGARSVDRHFASAPLKDNLPVLLGLLGVWNTTFLGCAASAILPYCQALSKLAPHIQQVSMESNGKGVALDGTPLNFEAGEIIFGEPGTNGQHSFYQLIHQGRLVPCEFVGAAVGQQAVYLDGEAVSNHDELMSNYFAQADALAYGKTAAELAAEGVPPALVPHKTFSGNRPSLSVLLPTVSAYQVGQILSLYEHKVAVQGFVWGINSFDQWGVELGKVLAGQVRATLSAVRKDRKPATEVLSARGFNYSTQRLLGTYLDCIQTQKEGLAYSGNERFQRRRDCSLCRLVDGTDARARLACPHQTCSSRPSTASARTARSAACTRARSSEKRAGRGDRTRQDSGASASSEPATTTSLLRAHAAETQSRRRAASVRTITSRARRRTRAAGHSTRRLNCTRGCGRRRPALTPPGVRPRAPS